MSLQFWILILSLNFDFLAKTRGQAVQVAPLPCLDESEALHSYYHAPPRSVPFPGVDPEIKRGFLGLFHREYFPMHKHNSPYDPVTKESCEPSLISPVVLQRINELCPKGSFFYTFAPRHLSATLLLQEQFRNLSSPAEVLHAAEVLLHRHEVNARVWYYALLGAILERPDLNGYYLAWAVDATPDLYITNSVINRATQDGPRPPAKTSSRKCTTAIGIEVTDVKIEHPEAQAAPVSGDQPTGNICQDHNDRINDIRKDYENWSWDKEGRRKKSKRQARRCVHYNGTRGATGNENRLWYFREDVMLNQHHWYWHQHFPQSSVRPVDRRGEQFYFMHHNIIARYNAERLSNGLPPELPINLRLGENIGSGYDSDLVDMTSGRLWTPRVANTPLNDVHHLQDNDFMLDATMSEMAQLYFNLTSHISQGYLLANRSSDVFPIDIRSMEGFNHLGNTIEAAEELSTHAQFYHPFGVHNLGHIAIALATDPDYSCELPTGVMADLTVTMRDPAFYKIHTLVDDMFHHYKATLPRYQVRGGEWPLQWDGVKLQSLEVLSGNGGRKVNILNTFWSVKRFPLEEGIDGSIHDGDLEVDICHRHLNHEPFTFRLIVDVNSCARTVSNRGTVRIFMAPRYDLGGRRFFMEETRKLMFQLDAFPVELRRGRNTITRHSKDSSLTRPWSRSLQDMLSDPDNGNETEYCGCGWPSHLFIPKGTPQGMAFDLFAMVTNLDQDRVLDSVPDMEIQESCNSPYIFCGVPFRRYPDARPMGYPFDRRPYLVLEGGQRIRPVRDLEEYVMHVSNMKRSSVIVKHIYGV